MFILLDLNIVLPQYVVFRPSTAGRISDMSEINILLLFNSEEVMLPSNYIVLYHFQMESQTDQIQCSTNTYTLSSSWPAQCNSRPRRHNHLPCSVTNR